MPDVSTARFVLAYEGTSVDDGSMDVRDFAPSLLGFADMFSAARRIVSGADAPAAQVRVRVSDRVGSFPVQVEVAEGILRAVTGWLGSNSSVISGAADLAALIGIPGAGVLAFIRWRRGRRIEKREALGDGRVAVTVNGDVMVVENQFVIDVSENHDFRRAAKRFVEPLRGEGITKIEARQGDQRLTLATSEDVESFSAEGDVPDVEDREMTMLLGIVRPHFVRGHRWGVSDGTNTFGAAIEDEAFWNRIESEGLRFGKGDAFKVRLRARQERGQDGSIKTEYSVVKVFDLVFARVPIQRSLLPDDGAPANAPDKSAG
jgi:hypothetical protein